MTVFQATSENTVSDLLAFKAKGIEVVCHVCKTPLSVFPNTAFCPKDKSHVWRDEVHGNDGWNEFLATLSPNGAQPKKQIDNP